MKLEPNLWSITHHVLWISVAIDPAPDVHVIPFEYRRQWQLVHHNDAQLHEGIGCRPELYGYIVAIVLGTAL